MTYNNCVSQTFLLEWLERSERAIGSWGAVTLPDHTGTMSCIYPFMAFLTASEVGYYFLFRGSWGGPRSRCPPRCLGASVALTDLQRVRIAIPVQWISIGTKFRQDFAVEINNFHGNLFENYVFWGFRSLEITKVNYISVYQLETYFYHFVTKIWVSKRNS